MRAAKIRLPDGRITWTVLDDHAEPVGIVRGWIVHLEQIHQAPSTVRLFVRHVAELGEYLAAQEKTFGQITIRVYDEFLARFERRRTHELSSPKLIPLHRPEPGRARRISPALRNQVHMAVKSFYRHIANSERFEFDIRTTLRVHDGQRAYKTFLEHINQRRYVRRKDAYRRGSIDAAQKAIATKRLGPDQVLELIRACHLVRDAFLVVLMYNTGLRISEALGLRHHDMDVSGKVVWVVPRTDNENDARAKSGRVRGVPIHDYVVNMYEDLVTSAEYAAAFESGTEYIFCNVTRGRVGRAMTVARAQRRYEQLAARSGVSFHWHMLRHSHASEAIAAGYGLLEVADRLGHASPQTTVAFYRHLFSAEIRKLYLTGPERARIRVRHTLRILQRTAWPYGPRHDVDVRRQALPAADRTHWLRLPLADASPFACVGSHRRWIQLARGR